MDRGRRPGPLWARSIRPRPPLPCLGVARRADTLGQRRAHELVEVAVEDARRVGGLDVGPQILDHLVRLQDVAADLVAPADVGLLVFQSLLLGFAPLQLGLVETGAQHLPGFFAVLLLCWPPAPLAR